MYTNPIGIKLNVRLISMLIVKEIVCSLLIFASIFCYLKEMQQHDWHSEH